MDTPAAPCTEQEIIRKLIHAQRMRRYWQREYVITSDKKCLTSVNFWIAAAQDYTAKLAEMRTPQTGGIK